MNLPALPVVSHRTRPQCISWGWTCGAMWWCATAASAAACWTCCWTWCRRAGCSFLSLHPGAASVILMLVIGHGASAAACWKYCRTCCRRLASGQCPFGAALPATAVRECNLRNALPGLWVHMHSHTHAHAWLLPLLPQKERAGELVDKALMRAMTQMLMDLGQQGEQQGAHPSSLF